MDHIEENTKCRAGEKIVSYMYGELSPAESTRFEDHLLECLACTDEFAAVADARFSVYEWQKLDFAPLPTPEIFIPYRKQSFSLVGRIASLWAFSPRLAFGTAAFAGVAAIFGFAVATGMFSSDEIASVPEKTIEAPAAGANSVPEVNVGNSLTAEQLVPASEVAPQPVAVSSKPVKRSNPVKIVNKRKPAPSEPRTREVPNSVPYLGEGPDISDESLRLAEVFDELDVSE